MVEEGGFKYDSDSYADDLPYWTLEYGEKPHLILPYTLSENDMRFVSSANFATGDDFCKYLKANLRCVKIQCLAGPLLDLYIKSLTFLFIPTATWLKKAALDFPK